MGLDGKPFSSAFNKLANAKNAAEKPAAAPTPRPAGQAPAPSPRPAGLARRVRAAVRQLLPYRTRAHTRGAFISVGFSTTEIK